MSEAGVNPVLSDHEVRELQLLIQERSGIVFDESRERFLTSRVVEHMHHRRLTYGMELLRLLRVSNVEYDTMLERLLTQETRFLRYPGLFSVFEQRVLPELQERKFWDRENGLHIWSAGCASGEEPYSIAMCICEAATQHTGLDASISPPISARRRWIAPIVPFTPGARWKISHCHKSQATLPGPATTITWLSRSYAPW